MITGMANNVYHNALGDGCQTWCAFLIHLLNFYSSRIKSAGIFLNRHNEGHHFLEMLLLEKYLKVGHDEYFVAWFQWGKTATKDHLYYRTILKTALEARYVNQVLLDNGIQDYIQFEKKFLIIHCLRIRLYLLESISKCDLLFSIMRKNLTNIKVLIAQQTIDIPSSFVDLLHDKKLAAAIIPVKVLRSTTCTFQTTPQLSNILWSSAAGIIAAHNLEIDSITLEEMTKKLSNVENHFGKIELIIKAMDPLTRGLLPTVHHQNFLPTAISLMYQLLALDHFLLDKLNDLFISEESERVSSTEYSLLIQCQTLSKTLLVNTMKQAKEIHKSRILETQFRRVKFPKFRSTIRIFSVPTLSSSAPKYNSFLRALKHKYVALDVYISANKDFTDPKYICHIEYYVLRCAEFFKNYKLVPTGNPTEFVLLFQSI
jgi:hypothetical protein